MPISEPRKTVRPDGKGRIILEPEVIAPAVEVWLWQNPATMKSVQHGLRDSVEGKLVERGNFALHTLGVDK